MSAAFRLIVPAPGGPEAIEREALDKLPEPGAGEVRIRTTAIGLNYIDVYHRSGLYPRSYPSGLGSEAAGVIDALGSDVSGWAAGDRVACLFVPGGTYATHAIARADALFALPDDVDDALAAATMLKGLTAWMLIEKCARVAAGQAVLVHAAAGGVGSIAVQWLKAIGAVVIGHAGSPEKAKRVHALGAAHALFTPFETLAAEVLALTGGVGVAAALDGVGKDSWQASLDSLARRGVMVTYGNASGPVPPIAPLELSRRGSLMLTRPTLGDFVANPQERKEGAQRLFAMLSSGAVKVEIGQRFALADAAEAHRALEARRTTGSTILLP
ncbi:quinone oxidoreductase family protein [Sphingomonas cavernae]|uniref:Quinone oxidoreductase n=1 Tax=Sphingomonas cavernae TaxID=2320861 RepID=A0A418WR76_9SPHN|nr:quinone oxidoreductase [Sphingomonas cavernae]RJF93721.1 quinone oxidoreductase [Sphingomonas cavernae]